ncbi:MULTISPECIES: thioredoxin [Sporomusaceae]|uniref:thioredoxin n=1 Tax=Sporomusaceae TaxID=1843490 RepID=UPI00037D9F68|nr:MULTISPECIES: thioredoxin [Sporomusaceae]
MATLKEVNDAMYQEEVLDAKQPVLVDFWAPWCSYCNKLTPVLEEISSELADKLKIVKINVDENRSLAQRYDIKGLPTMMLVKDGEAAEKIVGFLPKASILGKIEPLL